MGHTSRSFVVLWLYQQMSNTLKKSQVTSVSVRCCACVEDFGYCCRCNFVRQYGKNSICFQFIGKDE